MYRPHSTLEQWRILQAVVDHGGYAKAAAVLNKSQSSLNHAVAKLQTTMGVQLLEVRGRKAYLTEAGEVMLRRSRTLTQEIERLEELAKNLEQGWEPEIRISKEILFPTDTIYRAMEKFYHGSRGTRIIVIDNVLSGTTDAIKQASFDLVITTRVPEGRRGHPLGTQNMVLLCHPDHPLTQEPKIDDERLAKELQIVIRDTGSAQDKDFGWLKAEQRWTLSNFHEALEVLKRGLGFCWVPEHLANNAIASGELVHLHQAEIGYNLLPMYLVVPEPQRLGPAATKFRDILLEEAKQSPGSAY